jgi:hypothetical protein
MTKKAPRGPSGVITTDPVRDVPNGFTLGFSASRFQADLTSNVVRLEDWGAFEGILLALAFVHDGSYQVLGSGVLVAPGIALAATHVVDQQLDRIFKLNMHVMCFAATKTGLQIWTVKKVAPIPGMDITVLALECASALPRDRVFRQASLTTRLPSLGEGLLVCGFRAARNEFYNKNDVAEICGDVFLCTGRVSAQYPTSAGRDRCLLPFPVLEVENCPSWGGMSGGPVFDKAGFLVGLLASSLSESKNGEPSSDDTGPSNVSLLWPLFGQRFEGAWPQGFYKGPISLLEMGGMCTIERPEAVVIQRDAETNACTTGYHAWEAVPVTGATL